MAVISELALLHSTPEVIMVPNDSQLPVDLVKLHGIAHGDTAMMREIAGDYFLQAEEILGLIRNALENQEVDVVKRLVHKLKGSTVTLGMHQVRDLLQKMDEALEGMDFQIINDLIDQTRYTLSRIHEFFKTYLTS